MVLWLSEITSQDGTLVGGKALNLAEIARAGFPVPAAFCITSDAYWAFIQANQLQERIRELLSTAADDAQAVTAAEYLQAAIRGGHRSDETRASVNNAYRELAATQGAPAVLPVAVRSSASAEDLPTVSSAGQQTTLLNVRGTEELWQAILECWASLWSPRAVLYRTQRGLAQQPPVMAVLVQVMLNAEEAGVAFSRDPTSGEERVVVEAALGLGESVVGGAGDVDRYVASRQTGSECEPPCVAHKLHSRVCAALGGLQEVDVPPEARDVRVLTLGQVSQIAQTAMALERHFQCPQDVEWAYADGRLFVLQARPITTHTASFFTDILPEDGSVWTAGFLNERFPLPVSPLGWSLVRELLEELAFRDPLRYLGLRNVERLRITRLYRGHPYVNLFVFQTLYKVFPDLLLPEDAYRYFPEGQTSLRRQAHYPLGLFDPRFLWSMLRHFVRQPAVWSPWHNYRVWARFAQRHAQRSQQLGREFKALCEEGATVQSIWATLERTQQLNAELLALHRWSLTCADLTYSLLCRLLQARVGAQEALCLCTALVAGLPNQSVELNDALHDLAQVQDTPSFAQAFSQFISQYGHRSFSLDIYYPPFADEPAQVLGLLKGLQSEGRQTQAGQERAQTRSQAERQALRAMGSGPLGGLRRALFRHVLRLTRCYMPLREEQRFFWQKTLALQRHLFLRLAQHMVAQGLLEKCEHVFFLAIDEMRAYVNAQTDAQGYARLASTREQQFARLRQENDSAPAWSYPPFLCGNRPWETTARAQQGQFQGRAISPGLAQGRVVVVFTPEEFDKIRPGDVLVTRGIDPGWTPVFGLLSALVMEHGGQLSHGAVVAREYGLPTVAGIPGITQALHDGDAVIVDGLNGLVSIVRHEPTFAV